MSTETPENKPPAPPSPEGKPSKDVLVQIKHPGLIYKAIENTQRFSIAKFREQSLKNPEDESNPLGRVQVEVQCDKDEFTVVARLNTRDKIGEEKLPSALAQHKNFKKMDYGYILEGPNGTAINMSFQDHLIKFETGQIIINEDKKEFKHRTKLEPEKYNAALEDTIDMLDLTINNVYDSAGKKNPYDVLTLRPEDDIVDAELKNIEKASMTSEELIKKLQIEKPNVHFSDVGGQQEAIEELETLKDMLDDPGFFRKNGAKPPKGILLYGPPGTGKTLLAKALATESKVNFLEVKGSDIHDKYFGQSEKIVNAIFDQANQSKEKIIIFLDELDSIAPIRGEFGATDRVTAMLLKKIDGIESNNNITIIGATNRIEAIDKALLRPGRLDKWVEVGLPEPEGRKEIFSIHMKKTQDESNAAVKEDAEKTKTPVKEIKLFENIDIKAIAEETDGHNGSDIAEIIRLATEARARQIKKAGQEQPPINTEQIKNQVKKFKKTREVKNKLSEPAPGMYQ